MATIVTSDSEEPVFRVAAALFTPEGEKKTKMLFLADRDLKRTRIKSYRFRLHNAPQEMEGNLATVELMA